VADRGRGRALPVGASKSSASQLIDAGVDVVTIAKRLGHASANITLKIYAPLFRSRDGKAADAINAALANLGPKW
jgi:integrase